MADKLLLGETTADLISKLNALIEEFNNQTGYTLPVATSSVRGGIKIGYSASGANIPLKLSSEKGYVTLTSGAVTSALGYTPSQSVTVTQRLTSGTEIGSIKVGSTETKLYAPTGSASGDYLPLSGGTITGNLIVGDLLIHDDKIDHAANTGTYLWLQKTFADLGGDMVYLTGNNAVYLDASGGAGDTEIYLNGNSQKITLNAGEIHLNATVYENGTSLANKYATTANNPNLSYYATDNGSTTAGTWVAKCDNVTSLFDGLSVKYKVTVAGASTTTFNLNGLGAKTVYLRGTTKLTTHYAVDTMLHLIYSASTEAWYVADYDTNSYTLRVYRQTSGYNADYPIFVSRTATSGIGTAGSNSTYTNVYGVIAGDGANTPTINPYTGALKATSFVENGTALSSKYLGINAKAASATVADSANAVAWANVTGKPTIPSAYSLPLAASGTRGGIQIGYSASGANIPVQLSSEKAYVALTKSAVTSALGYTPPTTDTTYSVATTSGAGLMSAADKAKLDAITASADSVSFTQTLTSGTEIGSITINGSEKKIYAPTSSGSGSSSIDLLIANMVFTSVAGTLIETSTAIGGLTLSVMYIGARTYWLANEPYSTYKKLAAWLYTAGYRGSAASYTGYPCSGVLNSVNGDGPITYSIQALYAQNSTTLMAEVVDNAGKHYIANISGFTFSNAMSLFDGTV